ncbi:beta-lactamase family protein [Luteibacter aegosomatis]|uniref:serine hydrolase domain-containing protein n=1 Tax=Luteibacter aegosomatis TaxID=2911537 RepID=UPI001FF9F242|nr:serine hydrolase domain-containing protein [Luteibacter aegosomatis]UPG85101.1 beta-lactamase family protein [Luteibacter aegosomatis]
MRCPWILWCCLASLPAVAHCPRCAEIADRAVADGFTGVVLVGEGGRIDYLAAHGVARAPAQPMSVDTTFPTGSMAKWVACIVVMKLVERGQLGLDVPIAAYLPDYPAVAASKVTLRMLLSHSSGIPNTVDSAIKADPGVRELTLDNGEAVRRFASSPLAFEPGTAWDYSHANWIVAKAIVERVTGEPYEALVRAFVIDPLALKHAATFSGPAARVPGMALGFRDGASFDKPLPSFFLLAGGYDTSAPDLLRLFDGLFGGKILRAESLRELLKVVRPAQDYALGGRVKRLIVAGVPRTVAWEYGSDGAYRVLGWQVLDDGHTVIIMNNTSYDHQKIGDLAQALLDASYE